MLDIQEIKREKNRIFTMTKNTTCYIQLNCFASMCIIPIQASKRCIIKPKWKGKQIKFYVCTNVPWWHHESVELVSWIYNADTNTHTTHFDMTTNIDLVTYSNKWALVEKTQSNWMSQLSPRKKRIEWKKRIKIKSQNSLVILNFDYIHTKCKYDQMKGKFHYTNCK